MFLLYQRRFTFLKGGDAGDRVSGVERTYRLPTYRLVALAIPEKTPPRRVRDPIPAINAEAHRQDVEHDQPRHDGEQCHQLHDIFPSCRLAVFDLPTSDSRLVSGCRLGAVRLVLAVRQLPAAQGPAQQSQQPQARWRGGRTLRLERPFAQLAQDAALFHVMQALQVTCPEQCGDSYFGADHFGSILSC